jgi:hypothetical protein
VCQRSTVRGETSRPTGHCNLSAGVRPRTLPLQAASSVFTGIRANGTQQNDNPGDYSPDGKRMVFARSNQNGP